MTSHECKLTRWPWAKQLSEQNAIHMTGNGLRQSLTAEQDNTGPVAEMTKRGSSVIPQTPPPRIDWVGSSVLGCRHASTLIDLHPQVGRRHMPSARHEAAFVHGQRSTLGHGINGVKAIELVLQSSTRVDPNRYEAAPESPWEHQRCRRSLPVPVRLWLYLSVARPPSNILNYAQGQAALSVRGPGQRSYGPLTDPSPLVTDTFFSSEPPQCARRSTSTSWSTRRASSSVSQTVIRTKCSSHKSKRAMTVAHIRTRQQMDKWQNWRKNGRPLKTDVIFVVMNDLVNVLKDDVLILHCHENGDCQEPDDRHSERSHVSSELHCCQEEDTQVIGWCQRFLTNGHEHRKVPGQICWSQPEITVLEFQDTHGLVNVIVLRWHHAWHLWRPPGNSTGPPPLAGFRLLARAKYRPFLFLLGWSVRSRKSAMCSRKIIDRPRIRLLQSFLIIRGLAGFHHERKAIKH